MGLAASQARYLALTARKDDLEYQSQIINTRRLQLAYKTADIARAYSEGMNNKVIAISSSQTNQTNGQTSLVWNELTFKNLLKDDKGHATGFAIIGVNGTRLIPVPYDMDSVVDKITYVPNDPSTTIKADEYGNLSDNDKAAYMVATTDAEGNPATYKLNTGLTEDQYANLSDTYKEKFTEKKSQINNLTVNPDYVKNGGMDIQTLLVSGQAQIVTKAFFDYLVNEYGYNYQSGVSPANYKDALDNWQADENNEIKPDKVHSVVDWRADEDSGFKQRYYTEDDADVLAKYEAATAEVQAQDKMLEVEEKNIETQHKAIETEMESIKKVIQKNIEDTFKIFS